ncbi:ethanolamine ammonia-lyase subunit EutC [Aneurinibacillus aneurinilyticus]|uniref:Ethanolamine ammonia-lyase small subunit n=1 Tax=Aneurinibacillus aneurinilyticus TaxID=1391 RepID=A0A848CQP2_ANEAE|nr:ethanolamine ammonia-lyase subunit EutC [Aneurinibacillus aneurinilyticus]NME97321.1 ethanolamine ammonia-lyase subunit EutC [Aneurinibacillus aneurinilyticus]
MNQQRIEQVVEQVLRELTRKLEVSRMEEVRTGEVVPQRKEEDVIFFSEEKEMGVERPHHLQAIERAQQVTPARIGIGRAGTRLRTRSYLQFRIDHAAAQDAVMKDVSEELVESLGLPVLRTQAEDMATYLMDLDKGRKLSEKSVRWLSEHGEKKKNVQILVCDGLSSSAVEANIRDILPSLEQGLKLKNMSVARPLFVKRSRVWVQDHIASIVECDVVLSLIGERPGLATSESLSAYMVYRPGPHTVEADRTVISNIHKGGFPPVEAGAYLADLIGDIIQHEASGVSYMRKKNNQNS